MYVAFAGIIVE